MRARACARFARAHNNIIARRVARASFRRSAWRCARARAQNIAYARWDRVLLYLRCLFFFSFCCAQAGTASITAAHSSPFPRARTAAASTQRSLGVASRTRASCAARAPLHHRARARASNAPRQRRRLRRFRGTRSFARALHALRHRGIILRALRAASHRAAARRV